MNKFVKKEIIKEDPTNLVQSIPASLLLVPYETPSSPAPAKSAKPHPGLHRNAIDNSTDSRCTFRAAVATLEQDCTDRKKETQREFCFF